MEDIPATYSSSSDREHRIGDIFTPLPWALFAVERFGLFEKWMRGARIFDPTMGEGHLLEALIVAGLQRAYPLSALPVDRLFGNELNRAHYEKALAKFQAAYGLDMRANFYNEDILMLPHRPYDIVFGNPPWKNFADLPEAYKEEIKACFHDYELTGGSGSLLLGSSRIDLAALIIRASIRDFLRTGGEAVVFMPLSLLLNDGGSRHFRTYQMGTIPYALERVYDFNDEAVFDNVRTRYGLVHFIRDKKNSFPVAYHRIEQGQWHTLSARPVFHDSDPLSILTEEEAYTYRSIPPIELRKESCPRQGINTGGANALFIFDHCEQLGKGLVRVSNKQQTGVVLPTDYVYPLITNREFREESTDASRWVLLPYSVAGRPLSWEQIAAIPSLQAYLCTHEARLRSRKGVLLGSQLKRGYWWALLGVGPYNFFPFKIVWEAYGRADFRPRLFQGRWQANQSLQAYIPLRTEDEALRILSLLADGRIEHYLRTMKMEGTMNWAQPARIARWLAYREG